MKRWMIRFALLIIVLGMAGFLFREPIIFKLMQGQLAPTHAFDIDLTPDAPDYTVDASWVALPEKTDPSDFKPASLEISDTGLPVAVFFAHPTTYLSKSGWNAPLNDPDASAFIDDAVLPGQASAFQGCCDVYAPAYRQATFWSYFDKTGSGQPAYDLAYTDIQAAFDAFLTRIGDKPFIIAGHSQGSQHLTRLLADRISGTELTDKMIAGYLIGHPIDPATMASTAPDIPICNGPTDTGCYVTWNSMGKRAKPFPEYENAVCVNPLSWKQDLAARPAEDNKGSLSVTNDQRFETGVSGAKCKSDRLLVGPFQSDIYDNLAINLGPDNFHLIDYGLFYESIRVNAIERSLAYLEK